MRNVASQRAREWRVTFATPVTHAPALAIAYTPDRIVFLAQGGQPYRLLAGSAKAHHADAPIDVALAQWRGSNGPDWKPPLVTLGARTDAGGESALMPPNPSSFRRGGRGCCGACSSPRRPSSAAWR